MLIFSYIVSVGFLLRCMQYVINSRKSEKIMQNNVQQTKTKKINDLAIIIPVYQEEKIAKAMVEYFNDISVKKDCDIFYVTTNRDPEDTQIEIKKIMNKQSKILQYHGDINGKAAQINFAIEKLQNDKYDYFGIFDADSRPDLKAFDYVTMNKLEKDILQMPSKYTENMNHIGLISKANAFFQTRWTFCYEIPNWKKWELNSKKHSMMYLVGHGLFIRSGIGLRFSENTIAEDIEFGYRASLNDLSLDIIPFFDKCTVPDKYLSTIPQAARWFYGELTMPRLIKHNLTLKNLVKFIVRYEQILEWAFGFICITIGIIYSIFTKQILLICIFVISMLIYYIVIVSVIRRIDLELSRISICAYSIKSITNCLGPLLCIAKTLFGKNNKFNKTKR